MKQKIELDCIYCVSEWQAVVEQNLTDLAKNEKYHFWSRDTLFRYLIIMEAIQENNKERQEILAMIAQTLVQILDTQEYHHGKTDSDADT